VDKGAGRLGRFTILCFACANLGTLLICVGPLPTNTAEPPEGGHPLAIILAHRRLRSDAIRRYQDTILLLQSPASLTFHGLRKYGMLAS